MPRCLNCKMVTIWGIGRIKRHTNMLRIAHCIENSLVDDSYFIADVKKKCVEDLDDENGKNKSET